MSVLYLVRHGQAGTRENYDSLSDLGRQQAQLLGDHFKQQSLHFDAVYSGSLARQQSTAAATLPQAEVIVDPGWNEFDLAQVYSEYAPRMAADDVEFSRQFDEMQHQITASLGAHDAPIHRRWNDCDKQVVRAWVDSRYEYSGETWPHFVSRIHAALSRTVRPDGNTIVFTSATPIGICAAQTLGLEDTRAMWLAGVLLNSSFSSLRIRGAEIRLFSFNNSPHLDNPALRTFR